MKKLITILLTVYAIIASAQIKQTTAILNPTKIIGTKIDPKIFPKSIKYSLWSTFLKATLRSSFLSVNNYDPTGSNPDKNFKYYKKDDIHLRLGRPPMGIDSTFDMVPLRFEPFTVYFKSIKTNKILLDAKNRKLQLNVSFEKDDVEIATNCVDNLFCGGFGNPNFQIDDLSIFIDLEPFAKDGKISYKNASAKVSANAGHDGFNFLITPLDPLARAFNGPIFDELSKKVTDYLNSEKVVADISEKLNQGVSNLHVVLGIPSANPYFDFFEVDDSGNINYIVR
jgi:hypothetical protein